MDTAHRIVAERRRQVEKGYGLAHDDTHTEGELLLGALAYLCIPGEELWPWEPETFRPSHDPIRNFVKAGAMICAEGDRLLRCAVAGQPVVGGMVILDQDPTEVFLKLYNRTPLT